MILAALVTGACGRAERQAAEARADSLQRVLQHQQDSLKGARAKATADSLASVQTATAKATAAKRREDSLKTAREKAVADSVSAERARPRDLTLMTTTGVTVAPHAWADYGFALDSAADCAVHGHIEVKSSHDPNSRDDVEVFLFTSDDYANWKSNSRARVSPILHAGPQTATTLTPACPRVASITSSCPIAFRSSRERTCRGKSL